MLSDGCAPFQAKAKLGYGHRISTLLHLLHTYASRIRYHDRFLESFGEDCWGPDPRNESEPIFRLQLQWGSQQPPRGTYRVECLGNLKIYDWLPTLSHTFNSATNTSRPKRKMDRRVDPSD